ncbi:GNAT family N-acetyltransferase [Tianweitania sp. BSSL-BM11]|uniref:GNAT family N-acetyltransferase n=1 Tax=Tianweitania aestuarii TaxID=2814886 RepID=A0ABS5RWR3_9HYPH|nr:GNAT family N-acetyltransferase [Tianweitania aestuarii]MBS9720737.1 GNAT family N-acetyltransferase [Tianweitania aestuarii]
MSAVEISFDRAKLDFARTSQLLCESYWGGNRTDALHEIAFANSICAIALIDGEQVGFARAQGDRALFMRLSDVIVWPEHRGKGIGKALVAGLMDHPELRTVLSWSLSTEDAHALYEPFGFRLIEAGKEMRLYRSKD